jgi:hypothetical protein
VITGAAAWGGSNTAFVMLTMWSLPQRLEEWSDNDPAENLRLLMLSLAATCAAGLASGLTLGASEGSC